MQRFIINTFNGVEVLYQPGLSVVDYSTMLYAFRKRIESVSGCNSALLTIMQFAYCPHNRYKIIFDKTVTIAKDVLQSILADSLYCRELIDIFFSVDVVFQRLAFDITIMEIGKVLKDIASHRDVYTFYCNVVEDSRLEVLVISHVPLNMFKETVKRIELSEAEYNNQIEIMFKHSAAPIITNVFPNEPIKGTWTCNELQFDDYYHALEYFSLFCVCVNEEGGITFSFV